MRPVVDGELKLGSHGDAWWCTSGKAGSGVAVEVMSGATRYVLLRWCAAWQSGFDGVRLGMFCCGAVWQSWFGDA